MENCLDFENGYCFRNDSDCQGICEDYVDKHKIAEAAKLFFADPQDKEYYDINTACGCNVQKLSTIEKLDFCGPCELRPSCRLYSSVIL